MNELKPPADVSEHPFFKWVVLAVALVFVVMLILSALQPRGAARRPPCINNLHNIVIGLHNWASTNANTFPPQSYGPNSVSWRVSILPLMDQSAMYRRYHRDKPWNDPANLEFAKTKIPWYVCPTNPSPQDSLGRYYTAYTLLTGPGTAYDLDEPRKLDALPDGASQTVLLVEACGANIVWNEPRDVDVEKNQIEVKDNQGRILTTGGWEARQHDGEANIAYADGSVRTLNLKIDPEVRKALANPKPPE